jgi:hypothetical protein
VAHKLSLPPETNLKLQDAIAFNFFFDPSRGAPSHKKKVRQVPLMSVAQLYRSALLP